MCARGAGAHKEQKHFTMTSPESVFVGVPLGDGAPSPRRTQSWRALNRLVALLAVAATLLLCLNPLVHIAERIVSESRQILYWIMDGNFEAIIDYGDGFARFDRDDDEMVTHSAEEDEEADDDHGDWIAYESDSAIDDVKSESPVVILTADTIVAFLQDNPASFVVFDASFDPSWCVSCQRLAPTWIEFASKVSDWPVAIGKVDCQEYAEVCREQAIIEFPTFRWFQNGKAVSPDYKLVRTVAAFTEFTKRKLMYAGIQVEDIVAPISDTVASEEEIDSDEDDFTDDSEDVPEEDGGLVVERLQTFFQDKSSHLTKDTFDEMVNGDMPVFVNFYTSNCVHSQRLAPTWKAFADEIASMPVLVRSVECDEQPSICTSQGITALPTLRWFRAGEVVDYCEGERTVTALSHFVKTQMNDDFTPSGDSEDDSDEDGGLWTEQFQTFFQDKSSHLTKDTFDETVNGHMPDIPVFVNFYNSDSTQSQRLSHTCLEFAFKNVGMSGVFIRSVECDKQPSICTSQEITVLPTLRWFHAGEVVDYCEGDRTVTQMSADEAAVVQGPHQGFSRLASSSDNSDDSESRSSSDHREIESEGWSDDAVDESLLRYEEHFVQLSDENFHAFLQEHETVFVNFYAPWCMWSQKLAPVWEKFALRMKSEAIEIVKVDCVSNPAVCRDQGIRTFPTLRLYQEGKDVVPDYKMDRTVTALTDYVKRQQNEGELSGNDVEYAKPLFEREEHVERAKARTPIVGEDIQDNTGNIEDDDATNEEQSSSILPRWMTTFW